MSGERASQSRDDEVEGIRAFFEKRKPVYIRR
jgi:hypothetical protein